MEDQEKHRMRFFIFGLLFSFVWACTDSPTPSLSYKDRQLVDSLYRLQYDSLLPQLDSLCAAIETEVLRTATDSLMERRLSEIEAQKQRYKIDK